MVDQKAQGSERRVHVWHKKRDFSILSGIEIMPEK